MPVSVPSVSSSWTDPQRPMATHSQYRPDVDGLRAVAVLAVVVFHAFPELLPGGFVGVDVFFVISGYLISGIILRGLASGSFSILEFYARRVKRIFPALITMLAGVWALGWMVLLADEYQLLGKHIAVGAGFILNLSLYQDIEAYFGAINTPLIHLWSLGVEEQFYLLWPLFLMATWKLGRKQFVLIVLVATASMILNAAMVSSQPLASFYLPSGRLWELAMGGALAYTQLRGSAESSRVWAALRDRWPVATGLFDSNVRGVVGVVLLLASFLGLNGQMTFPGWWALAPCLGAFLLISAGPRSWMNLNILSRPTMVFIGLISYPLYLWHWPLLSFAHTIDWRQFTPMVKLVAVSASFILAFLTYKYIERPIRRSHRTPQLAGALCAAMAACVGIGYLVFTQNMPSRSQPRDVSRFVQAATEADPYPQQEGFLTLGEGARQVLFMGDSTIAQYHSRIEKVLAEGPADARKAVFAWRAGCAPAAEMSLVDPAVCAALMRDAIAYANQEHVDTVVIGYCWYAYFVGILDADRVGAPGPLVAGTERALEDLKRTVAGFVKNGKRVYIVLSLPLDPGIDPRQMIRRTVLPPGFQLDIRSLDRAQVGKAVDPFVSKLLRVAHDTGAKVIDPMSELCDAKTCRVVTAGGEPIYRDPFHLRLAFIRENVRFLDETVLGAGPGSTSMDMVSAAAAAPPQRTGSENIE